MPVICLTWCHDCACTAQRTYRCAQAHARIHTKESCAFLMKTHTCMCAERERVRAEAREAERLRLLALSTVMESRALISTTVRQIASRPAGFSPAHIASHVDTSSPAADLLTHSHSNRDISMPHRNFQHRLTVPSSLFLGRMWLVVDAYPTKAHGMHWMQDRVRSRWRVQPRASSMTHLFRKNRGKDA